MLSLLVLACVQTYAQDKTISGVITGDDGSPIPGASVIVKGTTRGTVTDVDGKYSLLVPEDATVVISFIGMQSQEVAVSGQSTVSVTLTAESREIDEVMVVAYGVQKKSAYTGAASEIKADKIENRQISNVSSALVGTMAGVQTLQTSGQPGESATVRIRGISSINGVNSPLYVVDGVPFDGDLSSINSQDIATMTVLKDAVSTSLYGARGSNGVVMITTKKGQQGKAQISVDAKWGAVSRATKNYDVIESPGQYYELLYQGYYNQHYSNGQTAERAHQLANDDLSNTGYQIYTIPDGQYLVGTNGKLNPNATLGYSDGEYYYTPDDWEDETFETTLRQEYNVSVSGATEQVNYFASFNFLQDDGLIKKSGFDRYSTRLNVEYKAKKWLTIGANIAYTHTISKYPSEQGSSSSTSSGNAFFIANFIAPIYPMYVRDADGNIMIDSATGKKVYDYGDGQSTNCTRNWMTIANPIGDLMYNDEEYNMDIFDGNWFLKADLTHGFSVTARLNLNADNTIYDLYQNPLYGQSVSYGGTAEEEQMRTTALTHQYLLNYINSFGDNNLSLTAGFEGYRLKYKYFYGYGQQLYKTGDSSLGNVTSQYSIGGRSYEYNTAGFFFSGNYNYAERYFLNVGYRRDGTSAFAEDNRWGDFFNVGIGWNLKNESFFDTVDILDMLKFRASFGQTGNDNHNYSSSYYGWYAYEDIYQVSGSNGSFSDGTLLYKGNPDLEWEKTNSFDVGFDYSFWNSRLHGSLDYYFRATSNLLDFKQVANSNGYSEIPVNMGTVRNSGFEFEITYDILKTKDLTWDVSLNGTFMHNKIQELSDDYDDGQYISGSRIYREGESIYNFYLVEYAGVGDDGTAQYRSVEVDDDGVAITNDDGSYTEVINSDYSSAYTYNRKETGNILPKFYGGLSTSATWKGFDLMIQSSFQLGGKVFDSGYQDLMTTGGTSFSVGQNFHKDVLDAWTEDNTSSDVPRLNFGDTYVASTSTRFLKKSNYLSLDNVTLGYSLPKDFIGKIGLESLRVYFSAENLALATCRQGLDPRMSFTSVSTAWYTARRTLSGGIKFTF